MELLNQYFKSYFIWAEQIDMSKLFFREKINLGWQSFKNVNGMPVLYALSIGLNFIEDKEYATLSLRPELFFTDKDMPKEQRQEVSRQYFSKLWNKNMTKHLRSGKVSYSRAIIWSSVFLRATKDFNFK